MLFKETRVVWKLYFYNILSELYSVIAHNESKCDATFAKPSMEFLNFFKISLRIVTL